MKRMINLNDLMNEQLRVMFDAEMQVHEALPKIHVKATDPNLRELLEDMKIRNEDQILYLKQAFNLLFRQKRGEKCDAMRAMLQEAMYIIRRSMHPEVMDAGIVTALQHIIHYQVAGYGAICNYANTLGLYEVASLMHQNLDEKKHADRRLANLAEEAINARANTEH